MAMTLFPFESLSGEHRGIGLAVGVVVGTAFGFVLERAGFGRAQKLMGQFYGNDMTVLKVMFTAIATAMLGLVVLSGAGALDLGAVQAIYPTFLWPMIAGGLALGGGFVMAGYCPGTCIVASASGKLDGVATLFGVVGGSLLYAELEPPLRAFMRAGELGTYTLARLLGLPSSAIVALVALVAAAAFLAAERIERYFTASAAPSSPAP
jgi:Sulphur transport